MERGIEVGGDGQRLTGKSVVAPDASRPTIDLPSPLERTEERTAFGHQAGGCYRFCFAKKDETLRAAAERLVQ